MVIQAQVTQNRMTKSCKLCQDEKSLKQGLRILIPKGFSFLSIRMENPRILDPRTTIPRTRNSRTMSPRISNPFETISNQIYDQGSRILNPRIEDQLPNLQQTIANTILITNISNSNNNLNKF